MRIKIGPLGKSGAEKLQAPWTSKEELNSPMKTQLNIQALSKTKLITAGYQNIPRPKITATIEDGLTCHSKMKWLVG
jgi:hypothetical protein